ncbi:MAG: 3-deoxy-D-manno-octulosonic acid transferase [Candidatus Omnitrophica bacterium]|nr:3-deoxy-D-manno-octulosonic acid transferase [Candidatus Omnitrophota bacterium]
MSFLYDLIAIGIFLFYLPIYLIKGKLHRGFWMRFGFLPKGLSLNQAIWIHAVSVGEAMVAKGLIQKLKESFPKKPFVLSTVTVTGNKVIQRFAQKDDFVTYLPLDLSFIVKKFLRKINPVILVILETEIWPNLIFYLSKRDIPIVVVNGRISDRSYKGYMIIRPLVKEVFKRINLFCVQSQTDAQRLINLGVDKERIKITGNMKFDLGDYLKLKEEPYGVGLRLGLKPQERLWIAGSTHPGEEGIVLEVYRNLLKDYPSLKLLIAPRHPERSPQIERLILRFGFNPLRLTQIAQKDKIESNTVFILDTVGELMNYYAIAEVVFVGGSLVKRGGHNILEPAFLEKPILFGPYMFNFKDIVDLFLKEKAAILVYNKIDLKDKLRNLLGNLKIKEDLSKRARDLVIKNQGVTLRNLEYILKILKR